MPKLNNFDIPQQYRDFQLPPPTQEKPAYIPDFTFDNFKERHTLLPKLPPGEKENHKYEWLKTKNGAQVNVERIADMKQEAREILEEITTTSKDILDPTLQNAARSSVQPQNELAKRSETSKVTTLHFTTVQVLMVCLLFLGHMLTATAKIQSGLRCTISTEGVKGMLNSVLMDSRPVSNPVPSSAVPFPQKTVLPVWSFGNAMAVNNVIAASASPHAKEKLPSMHHHQSGGFKEGGQVHFGLKVQEEEEVYVLS
ncbi:hypothetical protein BT69DRAFT_1292337 [Atractiella rhizophila]|nr:hypothetical protein BT69DRAFT_1292337 [Atractiella rhizophila]